MNTRNQQAGVTLIELMIGLLVGLVVVGGVITVYIAVSKSSADTLKQSRLSQEMSAIMNIMANDIRRAGFWSNADPDTPQDNPFTQTGTTAVQVRDASTSAAATTGGCITYAYDRTGGTAGTVDTNEKLGFRWDGGSTDQIKMRQTATTTESCGDTGASWLAVSDESTIVIESLSFTQTSKCVNASEPDGVDDDADGTIDDSDEYNCNIVTPDTGEVSGQVNEIQISMVASLKSDSLVKSTMTQTVRVRNDVVRTN